MSLFNVLLLAVVGAAALVATATAAAVVGAEETPNPASPAVQYMINMTTPGGLPLPNDGSAKVNVPRMGGRAVTEAVIDLITNACIFPEDNLLLRRLAYVETRDGMDPSTYGQANYYGGIWKVDERMFTATQANTPALQSKYAAIRDAFGIDWMSVYWQDLQKPLYSGLAAALYIYEQGSVPASAVVQAQFLNEHYHSSISSLSYPSIITQIPGCDYYQQMDVVFLLDSRTSASNFERMRDFVREVVDCPVNSAICGLNMTGGSIRVAVYQYWGNQVRADIALHHYSQQHDAALAVAGLHQVQYSGGDPDLGTVLRAVIHDAFSGRNSRPLSAKMIVVLTDKASRNQADVVSAGQEAQRNGVSVMAVGIGGAVNSYELEGLVTKSKCRHHLTVSSFQDLRNYVQLAQRTICNEPMIAQGMVHCRTKQCRNVAFPITSPSTTLITSVQCDDGMLFVTTRIPRPGRGFQDYRAYWDSEMGENRVTINEDVGNFIFAHVFPVGYTDPNCTVTMSTINGPTTTECVQRPACAEWRYPEVNPCQTGGNKTRFAYVRDTGMFIQCDLQGRMYLTKCPPGSPYYNPECDACLGGSNSTFITGCDPHALPSGGRYCGLQSNPCTRENILQNNLYFACPDTEKHFLQCNLWGHSYIRSCPEDQVWRQASVTCEYENTHYDPCHTPGIRFHPYPPDHHYYIDCGVDQVPTLMKCQLDLVWNPQADTCDYQHQTAQPHVTFITQHVTQPPSVTNPSGYATPNPSTGLLTRNHAAPCTVENILANQLYWPYAPSRHQYIQCDLWGDAWVKSCQSGFWYDSISHTCVDGPVEGDNVVG